MSRIQSISADNGRLTWRSRWGKNGRWDLPPCGFVRNEWNRKQKVGCPQRFSTPSDLHLNTKSLTLPRCFRSSFRLPLSHVCRSCMSVLFILINPPKSRFVALPALFLLCLYQHSHLCTGTLYPETLMLAQCQASLHYGSVRLLGRFTWTINDKYATSTGNNNCNYNYRVNKGPDSIPTHFDGSSKENEAVRVQILLDLHHQQL